MMAQKRTKFDFSRHKLEITKFDGISIYEFKRPDTRNCMLVFINTKGVMTVTGDLGNWVFCREFHPSAKNDSGVSDGYWDEKLQISSIQIPSQYNAEETESEIKRFKEEFLELYGREMSEEEKDWIEQLEAATDDEFDYMHIAFRENPDTIDYESVPIGKIRPIWLSGVYDGFDAMCEYMKTHNM